MKATHIQSKRQLNNIKINQVWHIRYLKDKTFFSQVKKNRTSRNIDCTRIFHFMLIKKCIVNKIYTSYILQVKNNPTRLTIYKWIKADTFIHAIHKLPCRKL